MPLGEFMSPLRPSLSTRRWLDCEKRAHVFLYRIGAQCEEFAAALVSGLACYADADADVNFRMVRRRRQWCNLINRAEIISLITLVDKESEFLLFAFSVFSAAFVLCRRR